MTRRRSTCQRLLSWFVLGIGSTAPAGLLAQDVEPNDGRRVQPFVSVGATQFVGDFGEQNHLARGLTALLGLRGPAVSAGASISFWPDVDQFRLTALHLEFMGDLAAERVVTPYVAVGVGHTWGSYRGVGPADPPNGMSGAFGLGVRAHLWSRISLSTDARLRTDGGGWNADWRALVEVGVARAVGPPLLRRTNIVMSGMSALAGPWRSVSPSFGVQMEDESGILSVQLAHWQIPRSGGGYVWDTRAVLASAQGKLPLFSDRLHLRLGPLVTAMGEGPDNGVRVGSAADLAWGVRLGPADLHVSVGYLYITRPDEPDQRGISWSVAVGR